MVDLQMDLNNLDMHVGVMCIMYLSPQYVHAMVTFLMIMLGQVGTYVFNLFLKGKGINLDTPNFYFEDKLQTTPVPI